MSLGAFIRMNLEEHEFNAEKDSLKIFLIDSISNDALSKMTLNWSNIDFWISHFKIKHPEILKAQIVQECGWKLNSKKAIQNGNICGMTPSSNKRQHTYTYIESGHCGYPNFVESIRDYMFWQEQNYHGQDYYEMLRKIGYAADTTYIDRIKSIVCTLRKNKDKLHGVK